MLTKGLLFAKQKALIVATPILRPVNEPGPLLIPKNQNLKKIFFFLLVIYLQIH